MESINSWAFIGAFFILSPILPALPIIVARFLGPKKPNVIKSQTYECGLETVGDTGATDSMVLLNRFEVRHAALPVAETGRLQQALLLTMNCLNGYFHFPYFNSLAEELVKADGKGAIAAFSPSGLSLDGPAHRFHRALLEELLHGGHERLGDAVMAAQSRYAESGAFPELLSIYHLLGDPALGLR